MSTVNVLVVDDDPDMCSLIATILRPTDIHVETALDGYQGLEKAEDDQPDLVVLDVMMPGMDGWETYTRMKDVTDAPIMFLTVLTDDESVERGRELGAIDYLPKPFGAKDFSERVKSLVGNQPAEVRA